MLKRFLMLDGCEQLCKQGKICWKAERHGVFACIHALLSWIIDLSCVRGTQRRCCYYSSFTLVGQWCSFSGSWLSDAFQDIWRHSVLNYRRCTEILLQSSWTSRPVKRHQTWNMPAVIFDGINQTGLKASETSECSEVGRSLVPWESNGREWKGSCLLGNA